MEENKKVINWYDNPNFITTLAISVLALIIILSQSFAVKNNIGTNDILRSLLNHNSIYLLGLIYFIPLKTLSGKKYFNHLNVFLIIVYVKKTIKYKKYLKTLNKYKPTTELKYYRDLPDENSTPGEAIKTIDVSLSEFTPTNFGKVFSATILDF